MNPPTEAALAPRQWNTRALEKARRMKAIDSWLDHGMLKAERIVDALESLKNKRDVNPPRKHGNIPL